MKEEFNLSEKIIGEQVSDTERVIDVEDVKEFIRLLKIRTKSNSNFYTNEIYQNVVSRIIDKLAGSKLVEEKVGA